MSVLTELKEYLLEKLDSTNANNPKANSGAVLLKMYEPYEEEMEKMLVNIIQTMTTLFSKETSDSPAGTSSLTNMSIKIGKHLYNYMGRTPVTWRDELRLGDLIVETFYNCGFINIDYPARRDSSHTVRVAPLWSRLSTIPQSAIQEIGLMATTFSPPTNISGPTQNGKALIKDRTEKETVLDTNTSFVRAINKLQQTGWRINERVFRALEREGGFISTKREKNEARELKRLSKLIEWKFVKAKANLMIDRQEDFYQYISADYRGRLYYNETFLNFQGSDSARGMMQFADPKPMGEDDTYWLAVHTAASYNQSYGIDEIPEWVTQDYRSYLEDEGLESISVDKMTLDDRVEWTQQNIQWILELGKTEQFAEDAEKKVAFLAACIEWYDYSTCEGEYLSCLPIGIDGSNNGWQHLGAISKDPKTGELVGLVPATIQKDFYVQTAKELINQTTDERLMEILSSMPMKSIRKGISKRGSMTRAYSAGASKIADNMFFDCRTEDYHEAYGIGQEDCNKFARLLIQAINTVCPGPLSTMAYFQGLAAFEIGKTGVDSKLVARRKELNRLSDPSSEELEELNEICLELEKQNEEIVYGNGKDRIKWSTPSGFEVEYVNWTMNNFRCLGTISGYRRVNHVVQQPSDKPDIRGFMCGISPNFIHSMDASHMSLVIDEWNGTFGAVHDSFSTHACDVDDLLALTKGKFIEMYDVDNFYDYIEDQLITNKTDLDVDQPDRGSLQIREIEDSDYFFA